VAQFSCRRPQVVASDNLGALTGQLGCRESAKGVDAGHKELLSLAQDLVAAENDTPLEEDEDRGKAALTELFQQVRTEKTPVIVERIVADIDAIVRVVRFPGWQQTSAGEREVRRALRQVLLKPQLHHDKELFDKAYGYVKQYY
jgi:type I restriction enzyme R subunit